MYKPELSVGDKLYKYCRLTAVPSKAIWEFTITNRRDNGDGIKYVIECNQYKNIIRGVINAQWQYETTEIPDDDHAYRSFDSAFSTSERYKEIYRLTAKEAWLDYYSQVICAIHDEINLLETRLTEEKTKLINTNQIIHALEKSLTEN